MQHAYGYEVGDTVWIFSGGWQGDQATSYKVESITLNGMMRLKNAAGAVERVNKYGTVTGHDGWHPARIVHKDMQPAKIAEVKYRYAFKQWQYELKNLTDELLRNPVMETVERISAHINNKPQEPNNERPATQA